MKTILFICTGNICRSPMAEGIFRHILKGRRRDIQVMSAGIGAMEGQPPSHYAVQAVKELGIDISKQRSRMLTAELVQQADYIFGMTHSHVDTVLLLYPQAAEKTFLLREFDDTLDIFEKDISDPIGGSYEVYLNCRDQIEQGIASLMRFIEQRRGADGFRPNLRRHSNLCFGVRPWRIRTQAIPEATFDQARSQRRRLGYAIPRASTIILILRRRWRRVCLQQRRNLGVLICTTGVGMCMAANKVPGIRAAQVCDEPMAALARQHNNANVLCLAAKFTPPEIAKKIVDAFLNAHFEGGRHERRLNKMENFVHSHRFET